MFYQTGEQAARAVVKAGINGHLEAMIEKVQHEAVTQIPAPTQQSVAADRAALKADMEIIRATLEAEIDIHFEAVSGKVRQLFHLGDMMDAWKCLRGIHRSPQWRTLDDVGLSYHALSPVALSISSVGDLLCSPFFLGGGQCADMKLAYQRLIAHWWRGPCRWRR